MLATSRKISALAVGSDVYSAGFPRLSAAWRSWPSLRCALAFSSHTLRSCGFACAESPYSLAAAAQSAFLAYSLPRARWITAGSSGFEQPVSTIQRVNRPKRRASRSARIEYLFEVSERKRCNFRSLDAQRSVPQCTGFSRTLCGKSANGAQTSRLGPDARPVAVILRSTTAQAILGCRGCLKAPPRSGDVASVLTATTAGWVARSPAPPTRRDGARPAPRRPSGQRPRPVLVARSTRGRRG